MATAPRWVRAIRRKLLAKPEITQHPVCPRCGRTMPVAQWDLREGCCQDCSTERAVAFDGDEGTEPFLPGDEDA